MDKILQNEHQSPERTLLLRQWRRLKSCVLEHAGTLDGVEVESAAGRKEWVTVWDGYQVRGYHCRAPRGY